MEPGLHT